MTPPAATAAGRGRRATKSPAKRTAKARGGLAKPPRSSSRASGRVTGRHAGRTVRRSAAPRTARRVSGPAGGRSAAALAVALPRTHVAPLGPRLVAFASTLPDRSIVDRMVRGRVWIGVLGFLLIGLVTMQVSLLRLNSGIGSAVERSSALERANGELRAQVSQLESGERIQSGAAALGMVMPPAGQISYLRGGDVSRAVAALQQGAFNDPARAIPLPGTGDPPDPLAVALTGGEDAPAATGDEAAATGAEGAVTGAEGAATGDADAASAEGDAEAGHTHGDEAAAAAAHSHGGGEATAGGTDPE